MGVASATLFFVLLTVRISDDSVKEALRFWQSCLGEPQGASLDGLPAWPLSQEGPAEIIAPVGALPAPRR